MKIFKILGITVAAVLVLGVLGIGFGLGWPVLLGPNTRKPTDRKFERTPDRLARGAYLVNSVLGCMYCHSEVDHSTTAKEPLQARIGAGAVAVKDEGILVYASNITQDVETGIGSWSDDEIARAIREGVSRDGHALFPMMPYANYRHMDDQDLASVVVYLRSLPAIRNRVPERQLPGPVPYLIRTAPQPVREPVKGPSGSEVERGKYLTTMASCEDCHSTFDARRQRIAGLAFAGGNTMSEDRGTSVIPNISPDSSGIGSWDAARFRTVIHAGNDGGRQLNPLMPYGVYGKMRDEDLDAVFAYLRTVKPVRHHVSIAAKPVRCPLCGYEHGYGEMNSPAQ